MMEQAHRLSELRKRGIEWDLNDWKWDGDLFIATPSNSQGQQFIPLVPVPGNSSNTSSSCSDDVDDGTGRRDLERKRRVFVVDQDSLEEAAPLTLKLGVPHRERDHWETSTAKKTKLPSSSSTRAVCQVEDCEADLTKAKDYHRRHKVCELHSKATKALVANVMQRFCQQCSRFHALQEFDEGKRSCRRRLAGHNKRRRKTQPETAVQGNSIDDQTNSVLLMSLLRILSNMHGNNRANQTTDQDLVAQLLKSLANPSGLHSGKGLSGLLHESQKLLNGGMVNGNGHSEKMSAYLSNDQQNTPRVIDQHVQLPDSEIPRKGLYPANSRGSEIQAVSLEEPKSLFPIKDSPPAYSETTEGRMKLNNFDLNDAYVDSDDGMEDLERSPVNENFATGSVDFPSWARQDSHQSSPPQTSGNSDSASAQSPSSSSGEAQSRTDRIVFKLFGKEPNDFPIMLRGQILDWLAHSPTEIESYIRPGCIILTIYLRLAESSWEELCSDLSSRLTRLFDISDDTFWRMGWAYVRVQNQIAIVHNGEVVLDTSLSLKDNNCCRILSVMPIAVSMDEQVQFKVRGFNLSQSTTRLLCALEGKYLDQEVSQESEVGDFLEDDDETEHANLSCIIPKATGRGFIEVEDHGLSSSFFPFIVAEKDVCSEIRTLENVLELKKTDEEAYEINKTLESWCQAMDFINEMGWLLHRSHLKSRLADLDPNTVIFSFRRFKWLMDFSMDHDWCAVVKKLLDILFAGTVGLGEHSSLKVALSEMGILHRAVRRNSRPMVEFLLRYAPLNVSEEFISSSDGGQVRFLFRPDAQGPAGLTPLHVAAGRDGSEDILDALTDDPGKNGIDAWKNARDSTGATPEDYARLRGHYAYIHIVQRKIYRSSTSGHVVVDIPGEQSVAPRQDGALSFEVGRSASLALNQSCKLCDQKKMSVYYGSRSRASLVYRPAMLSMVGIAAVCVCVALLFKSMPNVVCLFQPFRWEMLNYGSS